MLGLLPPILGETHFCNRAAILAKKAIAPPSWPKRQKGGKSPSIVVLSRLQKKKLWHCRDPQISVAGPPFAFLVKMVNGIAAMPRLLPHLPFGLRW